MENQTVAMSLGEFRKLPENKKLNSDVNSCAIVCYICGVISIAIAAGTGNWFALIDVALVVAAGVFIQVAVSRIASIVLLLYSIASCILAVISTGKPAGYLLIIAGVYAIKGTFALHKAWKNYQEQYGITGKTF